MTLEISNPEKMLFTRFTKEDFVTFYEKIAAVMLPHVQQRLVTMYRFPDGAGKEGFFQKDRPEYFPSWIDHKEIGKGDDKVDYVICNTRRSLVYVAAQVAEIHVGTSRITNLNHPDKMMFDLDPSDSHLGELRKIVQKLGRFLSDIGMQPYLMTTGKRGYHVAVPIKPEQTNTAVRSFALKIAQVLEQDDPGTVTTQLIKEKRAKRIFIDVNRNSPHQTSIAPYSVRATLKASVAVPLDWAELRKVDPDGYDMDQALRRMKRKQDPWRDFRRKQASLSTIIRRLKQ
jgi:bifunctional non-homologous end joining protein LigD